VKNRADPTDINLFVLDSVGHHVDTITRDKTTLDAGLITAFDPDREFPRFWSTPNDFFSPSLLSPEPDQ
jgi:hypothetical protein